MPNTDRSNIVSIAGDPAKNVNDKRESFSQVANRADSLRWLLFIMDDISQFCDNNNLVKSHAALEKASIIMENEIFTT